MTRQKISPNKRHNKPIGVFAILWVMIFMPSHLHAQEVEPATLYADSAEAQKFSGSPITLQLKDAEVGDVLRMIGESSGFNVVIHPQVIGKVSLSMVDVPWDQALDTLLQTLSLSAERTESVLRIMPANMMLQEKQIELQTRTLSESTAPKVTRIFPISYADPQELVQILQTFGAGLSTSAPAGAERAAISVEKTTNSLVVRDTPKNVDRIQKLIELLDIQVPQVLIETKVVEVSEKFNKALEGNLGLSQQGASGEYGFFTAFNSSNPVDALVSGTGAGAGVFQGGAGIAGSSRNGAAVGWSPVISVFGRNRITGILKFSEEQTIARVVSSPRTVVISGKAASIRQSGVAFIPIATAALGGTVNTLQPQPVDLKLDVTPRVTNDGSVMMKLLLKRDVVVESPDQSAAAPAARELNTEVLVDSGATLVIGGVMSEDNSETERGIPFLRKIPILGALFGGTSKRNDKTELMFFVSPKVLNVKRKTDAPVVPSTL